VPDAALQPSDVKLYAANGTEIKIIGAMTVEFTIEGQPMTADVVVSEDIGELILGIDWLSARQCKWDFGAKTASLCGYVFRMHRRPSKACLHRIYVAEDIVIPPKHEGVVLVKATWNGLHAPQADWILETKAVGPHVVTARTLLNEQPDKIGISVVNFSDRPFKLRADQFVGNAVPVTALESTRQRTVAEPVAMTTRPDNVCATDSKAEPTQTKPADVSRGPARLASSRIG